MRVRIVLVFSGILFAALNSWSQSSVHFDKPYYFAGEYMFFSFCNTSLPVDTISARVDLQSNYGLQESYYVLILGHCGQGYVKIPFEAQTARYELRITTHEVVSLKEVVIASVQVPIYNDEDFSSLQRTVKSGPHISRQSVDQNPSTNIKIRDDVSLKMDIPSEFHGDIQRISISVRDNELFGGHQSTVREVAADEPDTALIQGIPFRGRRELINPGPIRNHLLFAFNAEDMVFDGVGVNMSTNHFDLVLSPFFEKRRISFLDYLSNEIDITERPDTPFRPIGDAIAADSVILQHMRLYQEEKQINRIFRQIGLKIEEDSTQVGRPNIRPSHYVDVQDYTIRGTTVSLFKELSTSLKFRSIGKDEYRAAALYERNGITKFFSRAPLFLVNGSATRDARFIASIPLQEIGYFSIFSEYDILEDLSPMALGGIVYVDMIDPNYILPKKESLPAFTLQGLQVPIQYPVGMRLKLEGPSIGSLLYWNPSIAWDGAAVEIPIQGGDITSEYVVEVVLHLSNPGRVHVIRHIVETVNPGP